MLLFEFFDSLVAVIPMLGILIVVHELGHFLVAKAVGVRVLKFSIGFGAPIGFGDYRLRWERGGTEYVIGWIPLGGFVRMLGEPYPGDDDLGPPIPEDARDDEFLERKPVWQRLCVVFAGPAMNLLLPVVILMGMLWSGVDRADAIVGFVEADSPAEIAGVLPGDRIVSVDGAKVRHFRDVAFAVRDLGPGATVSLGLERDAEARSVDVTLSSQAVRDGFGGNEQVGWIGIAHERRDSRIALTELSSPAGVAGLRPGDRVRAIGGIEVDGWEGLARAQAAASPGLQIWTVERPRPLRPEALARIEQGEVVEAEVYELELRVPAAADLAALGVVPATALVGSVSPDKPAAHAGLRRGDLILAVDGDPIGSFRTFVSRIQTSEGREMAVRYARDGEIRTTTLTAQEETVDGLYDIEAMREKVYRIGLVAQPALLAGPYVEHRVRNPFVSLPEATAAAWGLTGRFLEAVSRTFSKGMGADQISGPIGIARIARESLDRGLMEYLQWLMLISINLAIINLLPIPILDGGQALIYSIEGIKRSPLSMRARELANSFGFALLVLIMGRAFWNDLTPTWNRFVDWISGAP